MSELDQLDSSRPRFRTFKGVFIPSILTILGVILYLRLGWVVGTVGLLSALVIITLSSLITFITGLSIASTATNMKIKGGGAYFMISRSFGVEAGAAIGFPLYLAQATGISFYLAGFAESLSPFLPGIPTTIIASVALLLLGTLAFVSANLALRSQLLIFVVIMGSIVSLFFGQNSIVPTSKLSTIPEIPFWVVFATFFPAVTGIEAGISMSGDLRNPSRSLPLGTLFAVLTGFLIYSSLAILLDALVPREALISDSLIMTKISAFAPLVYAAIWGATLSSALGAILGGPRTLQALALDRVVPHFLAKGHGLSSEPRVATIFTICIALFGIHAGDLDRIAPILSMFFLTSYGALNLVAGFEGLIGNPSWRPSFRTSWLVSMIGALACIGAMLMIDAGSSFVAFAFCVGVYLVTRKRNLSTRWSDLRRALLLYLARNSIYQLASYPKDAKTWRPNLIVIVKSPHSDWPLIEFSDALAHGKGFLTVASLISSSGYASEKENDLQLAIADYLKKKNIPALVKVKPIEVFSEAIEQLLHDYGLGPIQPNTVILEPPEAHSDFEEFCEIISTAHHYKRNVVVYSAHSHGVSERKSLGSESRGLPPIPTGGRIDIWWGHKRNASLMMALAYMLQTSPEWMGAKLHVHSLASTEMERTGVLEAHRGFLKLSRLNAEVEVHLVHPTQSRIATILSQSRRSDLVMVGFGPADYGAESITEELDTLVDGLKRLPRLALVMAGEEIDFDEIFT